MGGSSGVPEEGRGKGASYLLAGWLGVCTALDRVGVYYADAVVAGVSIDLVIRTLVALDFVAGVFRKAYNHWGRHRHSAWRQIPVAMPT